MTLVLRIENATATLANGEPSEFRIERHRLMIGRDDGGRADWRLPDPQRTVSAEHGLVEYRDGMYFLQDVSRNGLFVNGDYQRLAPREHVLVRGDRIIVGPYDIVVVQGPEPAPVGEAGYGADPYAASPSAQEWGGWAAPIANPHEIAPAADLKSFGREPPKPVFQSGGAMLGAFSAPPPPAGGDVWGKLFGAETGAGGPPWGAPVDPPPSPASPAPAWGVPTIPVEPTAAPTGPAPQIWGAPTLESSPEPGSSAHAPNAAPSWGVPTVPAAPVSASAAAETAASKPAWMVASAPEPPAQASLPAADDETIQSPSPISLQLPASDAVAPPPPPPDDQPDGLESSIEYNADQNQLLEQAAPSSSPVVASARHASQTEPAERASRALAAFLDGAGLPPDAFGNIDPEAAFAAAGARYRALVEGLVRMMEARARAKHELGVRSTVYAKNPLKFLQGPQAAQALIQPIGVGYLEGGAAVQEAFSDLQAHQIAMMLGMREAVRATVARFGPESIEKRAGTKGLLGSILPGQRKAQLYEAYEKEWEALAGSSDEAFLDVFAKAFRVAYDQVSGTGV